MHLDFTNRNALELRTVRWNGSATIALCQYGGAMYFQHAMTAAQARALASHLLSMADSIEPVKLTEIEGVPA